MPGQGRGGTGGSGQGRGGQPPQGPETGADSTPEMTSGRLDPRGRITVTTFRGLPRPGEVTTEFREAFERARSEAEAPLQSEQIPRRYREGIREYFDGLGKDE